MRLILYFSFLGMEFIASFNGLRYTSRKFAKNSQPWFFETRLSISCESSWHIIKRGENSERKNSSGTHSDRSKELRKLRKVGFFLEFQDFLILQNKSMIQVFLIYYCNVKFPLNFIIYFVFKASKLRETKSKRRGKETTSTATKNESENRRCSLQIAQCGVFGKSMV